VVWVVPIICVIALALVVAGLGSRYGAWSFSSAFWAIVIGILGIAGWFLGTYYLYETAAKRLGWQCSTGPQLTPDGRSVVGDISICGEYCGRPFRLTRSSSHSPGRRDAYWSSVEWTGQDLRVPSFSLHLTSAPRSGLARIIGTEEMAAAISGVLLRRHSSPPVTLDEATPLARRASLTAADAAAALAYFNPTRCDALDALLSEETLEGEPGRIAIHADGFPMPWRLEAFIVHANAVRQVLMG
jgi:hypothetical protein